MKNHAFFVFFVSNRNSKYYTENQELVTHGKKKQTEKTNVKQQTMKPKGGVGRWQSAIAKRKGPTCQPQPPIKPDLKAQDMFAGIKLNKKSQGGANMCNFQYHAS